MGWGAWLPRLQLLMLQLLLYVARQATAPAYTMGLVALGIDEGAARTRLVLVLRRVRQKLKVRLALPACSRLGWGMPCRGHGFGATTAEIRPPGALDAVLVPRNPGICLSPTKVAPVCRTAVLIQSSPGGRCCCRCTCWQGNDRMTRVI